MHPYLPISIALAIAYLWWKKRQALNGFSISLSHPKIPKFISAKGEKVRLSKGDVYYTLTGDKTLKTIVFIHGIQTPSWVFQEHQNYFTSKGYCVLSFDLYGRGFSSCPNVVYDDKLFVAQTEELVDKLEILKPFHIVGYSLGG
jgi:alpha-beta hydrolase superfamily lysophospholipase